ncbi:hypothetical protein [Methylobacterium iners]|uniref:Phage tail collar domain-containing protein n=1 Tax=Methylobacterium iners TaxID=418707 RepID=A0ABQ4S7M5_9HYPH|nr:hypothetical protein [Methylobacterium iners]GJD97874.1 hypothetical protein OCOJLMKI_5113 [Methylobacterium iners]
MMKRTFLALTAALCLLGSAPSFAADNLSAKDANAAAFKYRALDLGSGIFLPLHGTADETGAPIGPTNGLYVRQGGTWSFGLSGPIPAGTNAIGTVAVTSLPALPAGTNAIGTVGVSSLPPLAAGTNAIGSVETVVRSTATNRGGTLTTAGTAQTLIPANANRRGLAIQNRNAPGTSYSAATSVFMSCLTTATQDFNSLEIPAGALYETPGHHVGTGACSFVSGTANTPVYVREF